MFYVTYGREGGIGCWLNRKLKYFFFFNFFYFLIFFFFFGYTQGMWKFQGQGSNMHHSSNVSHSSDASLNNDNPRSLTHWATRELPVKHSLNKEYSKLKSTVRRPHNKWFHVPGMTRIGKSIETENRLMFIRGLV